MSDGNHPRTLSSVVRGVVRPPKTELAVPVVPVVPAPLFARLRPRVAFRAAVAAAVGVAWLVRYFTLGTAPSDGTVPMLVLAVLIMAWLVWVGIRDARELRAAQPAPSEAPVRPVVEGAVADGGWIWPMAAALPFLVQMPFAVEPDRYGYEAWLALVWVVVLGLSVLWFLVQLSMLRAAERGGVTILRDRSGEYFRLS
ncbi:MAG: hypothetical protein JHD16_18675 [Solirubrobacteraceae bacterium]|nr:hypothetical protein [Solirubrobacteraceae bacterium]